MNRCLLSVTRYLIPALVTACWATGSLAQGGPPTVGVNVLNTPLPVQLNGSASVTGSVNVANTPLSVQVVNPPNVPPSTVTIANPVTAADIAKALGVGTPFQAQVQCNPDNGSNCFGSVPVPSNKRIVLEYVGALCLIDRSLQTLAFAFVELVGADGLPISHFLSTNDHVGAADGPTVNSVSFGQTVRLYAPPGTKINVNVAQGSTTNTNPVPSFPQCTFSLSGQSVPVP